MTSLKCDACESIREKDPNLYVNGFSDDNCENLANGKGLSGKGDNCDDLHDMNDCFIGFMDKEVNTYESCDWKVFMHKFIPNLWTTLKAIICTLCGISCHLNYVANGADFKIGEEPSDGSYVVAGKGISFMQAKGGSGHTSDVYLQYIAGGLVRGSGSLKWYQSNFAEPNGAECYNFDNGSEIRKSNSRKGQPLWLKTGRFASAGVLLYEIRVKKSQYPQIKRLFSGFGHEGNGGAYRVNVHIFDGDRPKEGKDKVYAFGNFGTCDDDGHGDGSSTIDGTTYQYDDGHEVPKGWVYVQVRLSYSDMPQANSGQSDGRQYTPQYFIGARMDLSDVEC